MQLVSEEAGGKEGAFVGRGGQQTAFYLFPAGEREAPRLRRAGRWAAAVMPLPGERAEAAHTCPPPPVPPSPLAVCCPARATLSSGCYDRHRAHGRPTRALQKSLRSTRPVPPHRLTSIQKSCFNFELVWM